MRRYALLSLIFLFLFIPVISQAEILEGSIEITPFGGVYYLSHDAADPAAFGLRLGYNITPNWGVEGSFTTMESVARTYNADVLYHFTPEGKFNPFVFAGIGGAHVHEPGDTYDTFIGDIGVGLKYFFSDKIAFRADVRDVFNKFNGVAMTAGVTFVIGGKTPKAVPPPPVPAPAPKPEVKPVPKPEPAPTPKPAPAPAPKAEVAPLAEPVKIILEDIHFDFDKASLTPAAVVILKKNIMTMKENSGVRVQIEGHACAHGAEKHNMALGERRAHAVREYLLKEGISADRLTTISYGETRLAMPEIPTSKNKESVEAKTNRRVHFEVIIK